MPSKTFNRAEAKALTLPGDIFPDAFWPGPMAVPLASSRLALFAAVEWLGEGERCLGPDDAAQEVCDRCDGSGYHRKPADLLWALARNIDPAVAVVAVWASVLRVLTGTTAIAGAAGAMIPEGGRPPGPCRKWENGWVVGTDEQILAKGFLILDDVGGDLTITVEVPE